MVKVQANSNGKIYVSNGKALVSTGGGSNIESIEITPTTSVQEITAPEYIDGYNPITVNAVSSSIDSNIQAENIKKDVEILGVTGTYEGSGGGGSYLADYYVENGVAKKYDKPLTGNEFSGITSAFQSAFISSFTSCQMSGVLSFPDLVSLDITAMFQAFSGCTQIEEATFPELTTVNMMSFYQTFTGDTKLKVVRFPKLTTFISSSPLFQIFNNCTALTDVYFNGLTSSSLSSDKSLFSNMLNGTGGSVTHTIHFPSNLQSNISGMTGYPNFGGSSGYVTLSFDLPATS